MTIREVTKEDFNSLYKLWKTVGLWLYPIEEEKPRFDNMLTFNSSLCLVLADEGKKVIGSILGAFDGRTVSIHRLAVHPDYQERGYGARLVKELEDRAGKQGIKKIAGQIHVSNLKVLGFYEKQGFRRDDTITVVKRLEG